MTPVENVRHLEGMNSQLQGELETAKLNAATAEKQLKRETAKCQSMETHMKVGTWVRNKKCREAIQIHVMYTISSGSYVIRPCY